jgi:propanol-preferring alcohol dehydrogenase
LVHVERALRRSGRGRPRFGSRCGSRRELAAALDLSAAGDIRSIVTDRAPLNQVNEALDKLRSGEVLGRLVLDIAGEAG